MKELEIKQSDKLNVSVEYYKNKSLNNIDGEVWKEIKGYEGLYSVSDFGRIKSFGKIGNGYRTIIMSQVFSSDGYLSVQLWKRNNSKQQKFSVARLVGLHFVPNPDNKPEINHKKGIKIDNRDTELEWNTGKENSIHALDLGLSPVFGETHHKAILNNRTVLEIFNSDLSNNELSKLYKVSPKIIGDIKRGKTWSRITGKKYCRQNKLMLPKTILTIFSSDERLPILKNKYNVRYDVIRKIKNRTLHTKVTGNI